MISEEKQNAETQFGPRLLRYFCCSIPGVMLLDSSRKSVLDYEDFTRNVVTL